MKATPDEMLYVDNQFGQVIVGVIRKRGREPMFSLTPSDSILFVEQVENQAICALTVSKEIES